MATPPKPPRAEPPLSADWPNLSQVITPGPKSDLDTSLPPLKGLPPLKRPGPATPMPAVPTPATPKDTAPVWTDESVYIPTPPARCEPAAVATAADKAPAANAPAPDAAYLSANFRGQIGKYQIKGLIGEGGMGLVFKAEDIYLRRTVALKVMKPHVSNDDVAWKMFLNEARATAALQNPRIATVWEVDEVAGTMYLAMELLKGESLEARLQRGRLPLIEALGVVREAALGLEVAHETGFFHRDIKPANLWLTGLVDAGKSSETLQRCRQEVTGEAGASRVQGVKLLDFGLVRMERDSNGQMRRGTVVGTPAYMAPEQAMGEMGDARSDLFSLGVVLYRLVTGELPFQGDTSLELMTALATQTPKRLTEFSPYYPPLLVDLVARLLSHDPAGRPSSATHVAEAIRCVEVELANPRKETGRSNRRSALLVGSVIFFGLTAVAAWFTFRGKPKADAIPIAAVAPANGALAPHQVTFRVGERVTVEFTVERIEKAADGMTHIYANDPQLKGEKFRLILPYEMMKAMTEYRLLKPETAVGQTIRAHGVITRDGTVAELLIQDPTQFDRLPPREPGDDKPLASARPKAPAKPPAKSKPGSPDNGTVIPPDDDDGLPLPNGLIPPPKTDPNDEELAKALEDLAKLLRVVPGMKKR